MNFQIIKRTLGWILLFEALFFLVPEITAIVYGEWDELLSFLVAMTLCVSIGIMLLIKKPTNEFIYAKEGFVIVALSWIAMSIFGALPFWFNGVDFVDALFEIVSGFTTTGSTIFPTEAYPSVEALPKSLLIWRSFSHWVGGMGVLVLIMAFLPLSGARNMHIMRAESPGPTVDKLVPRVKTTAAVLYSIYLVMTIAQFVILLCGKMPAFDALNTSFATAGTGGFSVKSDGIASYSPFIQVVTIIFMLLFSINFNSYYLLLRKKPKEAFNTEVKAFLIIVFVAIVAIAIF